MRQRIPLVAAVVVCMLGPGVRSAESRVPAVPQGQAAAIAQQGDQQGGEATAQSLRTDLARLREEFDALRQQYEARLSAIEARLKALEVGPASVPAASESAASVPAQPVAAGQGVEVPAGASGAGGPQGTLPVYGNTSALSKIFNPDIAVIGNFTGAAGRNDVAAPAALEMREAEASFQAIVDPFARADFFVAFGSGGEVDLEEGFVTLTSLPASFLVKAGKIKASYGKVNQMHAHVRPWTDLPLMTENLLGGEEGVTDSGLSVSRLIPNPWMFLEATGEVYRGESTLFRAPARDKLTYVGHLRGYQDLSESSNVDLGVSAAYGHNDAVEAGGTTRLLGLDATFRYRPLRRAIYRRFVARTELTWSRRSELAGLPRSFGAYVSAEYQFARRWFGGFRFDYSDRATDPFLTDKGGSALVTFWPSEFSQVRGQYRRTRYGDAPRVANEFLFQLLFSIGAHGAHVF